MAQELPAPASMKPHFYTFTPTCVTPRTQRVTKWAYAVGWRGRLCKALCRVAPGARVPGTPGPGGELAAAQTEPRTARKCPPPGA